MPETKLAELTVEELEAANQALMKERRDFDIEIKKRQMAIAHELDRRARAPKTEQES